MMLRWHAPAQVSAFALTLVGLSGCYLAHGLDREEEVPAPAGPPITVEVCEVQERALSVEVFDHSESTEPCEYGPHEGWVRRLNHLDDGLEVTLDSCGPDDDCDGSDVCTVRIEGVRAPGLVLEGYITAWVEPWFVRLSREVSCCRGPGCLCGVLSTVLYVRAGNPASAAPDVPPGVDELTFARGADLCGDGVCGHAPFALISALDGTALGTGESTSFPVRPGETLDFAGLGLAVHLVGSAHDACTDEPADALWVAWLR